MNHSIYLFSRFLKKCFKLSDITGYNLNGRVLEMEFLDPEENFEIEDLDFQRAIIKFDGVARQLNFKEFINYLQKSVKTS